MAKKDNPRPPEEQANKSTDDTEGYPLYPPSEDIYNKYEEVKSIDPEDLLEKRIPVPDPQPEVDPDTEELKELGDDIMGTDLDVPGADLDDDLEEIGSEDEENNYYSLGGDNHKDLEEDHID